MEKKVPNRDQVNVSLTWDLTRIFATEADFYQNLEDAKKKAIIFEEKYCGKLNNAESINACIDEYKQIYELFYKVMSYAFLNLEVDMTNSDSHAALGVANAASSFVNGKMSFINTEIVQKDEAIIREAAQKSAENALFLNDILRAKPHTLGSEAEKVMALISPALGLPGNIYQSSLHGDLKFPSFKVGDKEYQMTFNQFESSICFDPDTKRRRAAYEHFYDCLGSVENTMGTNYQSVVSVEKIISDMKNHKNVFDFLLFEQKVTKEMYDNQIDIIYEHLAPHMRRYASLIKKEYNLDKITYADLKLPLMHEISPSMTIDEAKKEIRETLKIMGDEYMGIVNDTLDNRGVDYVQNVGKSGGAFCATIYGNHSYILLSWGDEMDDIFTLVHELGHAGHFGLAHKYNQILNTECSTYFVEAPSTMNELLLYNNLYNKTGDEKLKKALTASVVGKTYYHNFVTHLTEAHFQRKVYKAIEEGRGLSAQDFNKMKLESLREFWGDEVEIPEYAGRTWMRQQHYYMGLYPYTYSAGLTVATTAAKKIFEGDTKMPALWLSMLKTGGVHTPLELGKMVGADMSTKQPLLETIDFIGSLIDRLE